MKRFWGTSTDTVCNRGQKQLSSFLFMQMIDNSIKITYIPIKIYTATISFNSVAIIIDLTLFAFYNVAINFHGLGFGPS